MVNWLANSAVQPIRGQDFGEKWLEFISLSQIEGDYNFSIWQITRHIENSYIVSSENIGSAKALWVEK